MSACPEKKGALWRHLLVTERAWICLWLWSFWLPMSLILESHVGLGGTSVGCTSLGHILREGSSCKTVFARKQ